MQDFRGSSPLLSTLLPKFLLGSQFSNAVHPSFVSHGGGSKTPSYVALSNLIQVGYTTVFDLLLTSPRTLATHGRCSVELIMNVLRSLAEEVGPEVEVIGYGDGEGAGVGDLQAKAEEGERGVEMGDSMLSGVGEWFTSGDVGIDTLLGGGGIRAGSVTEFVGESSSGKSTLLSSLSLTAQLPTQFGGLGGSVISILTDRNRGEDPCQRYVARLRQMATKLANRFTTSPVDLEEEVEGFMNNIHLAGCDEVDELINVLEYHIPLKISQLLSSSPNSPPRLLLIDSLTSPFRFGSNAYSTPTELLERKKQLCRIGAALKKIAIRWRMAVVVANQVVDVWNDDGGRERPLGTKEFGGIDEGDEEEGYKEEPGQRDEGAAVTHDEALTSEAHRKRKRNPEDTTSSTSLSRTSSSSSVSSSPHLVSSTPPSSSSPHNKTHDLAQTRLSGQSEPRSRPHSPLITNSPLLSTSSIPRSPKPPVLLPYAPLLSRELPLFSGQTPSLPKAAALGPSWPDWVNTRIMLSRTSRVYKHVKLKKRMREGPEVELEFPIPIRKMTVVFSAFAPPGSIDWVVDEGGEVRGFEDSLVEEGRGGRRRKG